MGSRTYFSKPWPRAARSSPPESPASRTPSRTKRTACWCPSAAPRRWRRRCVVWPTSRSCARDWPPPPAERRKNASVGTGSSVRSKRSMSRRQRWTPVKGTANRIYDPVERIALGALDLAGRALFAGLGPFGFGRSPRPPAPDEIREGLVLRLDRIGDAVMCQPAIHDLRAAMPKARLRLAVGQWSEPIARTFPVDEVLVWSAPWVGRKEEGALGYRE